MPSRLSQAARCGAEMNAKHQPSESVAWRGAAAAALK